MITCKRSSWTSNVTAIWIVVSAWFVAGGMFLSYVGQLNRTGCAILLAVGVVATLYGYWQLHGGLVPLKRLTFGRHNKPFVWLYLLCAAGALAGGLIHPPTNCDALSYRIPRILYWLSAERWHWIGGLDPRMDFSATGFEWLMLPGIAVFHSLRLAFLFNIISFVLLPGLVFSVFTALGVKRSIAATWMWILPCASCFVMEAGSIGNDFIAVVYVLAALHFALRAIQTGRHTDVILAVLSAALMTGAKASNLPLLLPIAICLGVLFYQRRSLISTALLAAAVATLVSLAPIALMNQRNAGHWTGEPDSPLRLKNPLIGLVGNSLILASACLAPAVFPPANQLNEYLNVKFDGTPGLPIKAGFMDFRFTQPQLASEENSGLGLGVTAALVTGLLGARKHFDKKKILTLGGAVGVGFWVAVLFYMMKLGNCGAPRLIAPYYIGLIALPLLLLKSGKVFKCTWWRWSSLALLVLLIPALVLNPARPLLPMAWIVKTLKTRGCCSATLDRLGTVYDVYANRSDAYRAVRQQLPPNATSIGFAGTSAESQ